MLLHVLWETFTNYWLISHTIIDFNFKGCNKKITKLDFAYVEHALTHLVFIINYTLLVFWKTLFMVLNSSIALALFLLECFTLKNGVLFLLFCGHYSFILWVTFEWISKTRSDGVIRRTYRLWNSLKFFTAKQPVVHCCNERDSKLVQITRVLLKAKIRNRTEFS